MKRKRAPQLRCECGCEKFNVFAGAPGKRGFYEWLLRVVKIELHYFKCVNCRKRAYRRLV